MRMKVSGPFTSNSGFTFKLGATADEERVFLVSEELEFRTGETDGEPNFVWRDLQGDVDEFYEYVAPGTNGPTRAFFETCMYRAMYERKYKTNADGTDDAAFEEFTWQYVTIIRGDFEFRSFDVLQVSCHQEQTFSKAESFSKARSCIPVYCNGFPFRCQTTIIKETCQRDSCGRL